MTIGWLPPAECGSGMLLGYSLQIWVEGAGPLPLKNIRETRAQDVIAAGELRRYRVAAFNEYGAGEFSDEVTAALPVAAIGVDRAVGNLSTVFSFGSISSDPDGRIVGWRWDFGDGQTAPGANVTHRYAGRGNFTVNLTVRDNSGGVATTSVGVRVENRPPVLTGSVPVGSRLNFTVAARAIRFAVCATDPDGDTLIYLWLVDGVPSGEGDNCTVRPDRTGDRKILFRVRDGEAAVERAWEIKVSEPPVNSTDDHLQPLVAGILAALFLAALTGYRIRRRPKGNRPAS